MPVESVTYISDLNATNPVGATDPKSQGDDHIRNIKLAIKNTFPNINGAVTASVAEMNLLAGITASTAELNTLNGITASTAELNTLDGITATVTELNLLDGITGYTGSGAVIAKSAGPTFSGVTLFGDGAVGGPGLAFSGDPDTGIYRRNANSISFSAGGGLVLDIDPTAGLLLSAGQYRSTNGSAAAPSFTYVVDADTGMYRESADAIGFATGGEERFRIGSTFVYFNGTQIWGTDGDVSAPGIAFADDTNTGLYRIGTDQLGFSEGGTGYSIGYRNLPQVAVTSGRTLVAGDSGKHIRVDTTNGQTITIPPSVFSVGDVVTLVGNTGSASHTLARGSGVTLYWAGTNFTDANRTLTNAFVATIICISNNVFVVAGTGIS